MRMGSVGGRVLRAWDSWRREPLIPVGWGVWLVGVLFFLVVVRAEIGGGDIYFHTVVFCVVVGILDRVSPADGGGVVV